MPGPYDFIGQDEPRGGFWDSTNWAKKVDLTSLFSNPFVIGADLLATQILYNPFAGPKALQGAMKPAQWMRFQGGAAKFNKVPFGAATPEHMQSFVMKMNAKELGTGPSRYAANVGGTLGRDFATHEGMAMRFGKSAARRMQFGRAAMGLSRFMLWYTAIDLGIGLMKSVAESIGSYEKPNRANPSRQLETGGVVFDTRHAQTQRQRSIQAIHNTQLSTRACMGSEAALSHYA